MCGIYGFASAPRKDDGFLADAFFAAVARLLEVDTRAVTLENERREEILGELQAAHAKTFEWVQRRGFLAVLGDPSLAERLRRTARDVEAWTQRLEDEVTGSGLDGQANWEFFNRLIVGGKDIAWQIDRDVLAQLSTVRELVPGAGDAVEPDRVGSHAWQLHMILSGLDRLEVRGRDSAGIAVYVRFPDVDALERFLDGDDLSRRHELATRHDRQLRAAAVARPQTAPNTLLFSFKVASEIGRMGDNVAALRARMTGDSLFQAALLEKGVEIQCLAHTRWASNGIISESNCHPVDSTLLGENDEPRGHGDIVAVLNGDIDNYQELLETHIHGRGLRLDEQITTDAKIIPVVVQHHYEQCGDLTQACQRAFAEFEGSMAIGVMAADRPHEMLFAQKGSGQGLFLGVADGGVAVASEMYGLVEMTPRYIKAEGERVTGGEVFRLDVAAGDSVRIGIASETGNPEVPSDRFRTAEITTRDINRGEHSHFLAKEISESVASVSKTLRGKFDRTGDGARSLLGEDVFPAAMLTALRDGSVRRVYVIGQGTAAVAGQGVAHLLRAALRRVQPAFRVVDMKATELSGHYMDDDLSDTLVVAISQSGTTTDTNRTVDMARQRGAWVIGIVNRRNSDLVYKSHGVLYTSDGRDIEMSVASTKAFYAQNVAGQVLALALALELAALGESEVLAELDWLDRLPDAMRRTLELSSHVDDVAARLAPRRRYWALVGSGANKIAADEIRIKLSELCYKSIASDFLEDKKHIDLSSEPLVLVCASGAPEATVSDIVKEAAIFKAHSSIPIVITEEGESRFDPYAAAVIKVPPYGGQLSYLLATMVGHLFGFHAARAFDGRADSLRRVRAEVLERLASPNSAEPPSPEAVRELSPATMTELLELDRGLENGDLDSGLDVAVATRVARAIDFLLGRASADSLARGRASFAEALLAHLSEGIQQLSRPIDAIKHQAKTVTVGISRSEEKVLEGVLWESFRASGLKPAILAESHRRFLTAFEPLVTAVDGMTVYRVAGLDALGRPTPATCVEIQDKHGCAKDMVSRCDGEHELTGTKWGAVKRREVWIGYGQTDGRRILVVPALGETTEGHLVLFHVNVARESRASDRLRALSALERRLDRVRIAITERGLPWHESLLEGIDTETLFFAEPEHLAELAEARG